MIASEHGYGEYEYNGDFKLMGYAPIEGTAWSVAISADKNDLLAGLAQLQNSVITTTFLILLLGVIAAFIIGRRIAKPITLASETAQTVSQGDLTVKIRPEYLSREDEVGGLVQALEAMITNLRNMVEHVSGASQEVAASSEELSSAGHSVASTMQEVSASTEEIAAGMEEVSASTEQVNSAVQEISFTLNTVAENVGQVNSNATEIEGRANQVQNEALNYKEQAQ